MEPTWKRVLWWIEIVVPLLVAIPFLFNWVVIDKTKPASQCLGITIITAVWWILEPVPIVVTAFIPILGLPLVGVSKGKDIASSMFTDTSLVFLGGFIFSVAMVKWNLHSRIALKTVIIFGLRPRLLLLGICLVTGFLSMWISNTATALTMVPNALAIVAKLEEITGDPEMVAPFAKALFLGIAFSAGIGGMATLIGTPPNLIFAQTALKQFPKSPAIGFSDFFFVAFPMSVLLMIIMYMYFVFVYMRKVKFPPNLDESVFRDNYDRLGPMSPAETVITTLFVSLALLWLFRADLNIGSLKIKGWSTLLHGTTGSSYILDGTVAMILSILLFFIHVPQPSEKKEQQNQKATVDLELKKEETDKKYKAPLELDSSDGMEEEDNEIVLSKLTIDGEESMKWVPILEWDYTEHKIPWSILFLFSGGFALNQGFIDSKLDKWIGEKLKSFTDLPLFVLILIITYITSALSNVSSNTACANIVLPIVAALAQNAKKYHPWLLMLPATFATSICFILPIATPPNLICLGSGRITTKDFLKSGTFINIVGVFLMSFCTMYLTDAVYDTEKFPTWANTSSLIQFPALN